MTDQSALPARTPLASSRVSADDTAETRADGAAPSASADTVLPFPATLDEIERAAVAAMIARFDGNKSAAAAALGISRSRLYRILGASPNGPAAEPVSRAQAEYVLALLAGGNVAGAEAAAEAALARAVRDVDGLGEGEALRVLGIVALASSRVDHARVTLAAALGIARRLNGVLLEAESLEALAAAELAAGEEQRASSLRAEADRTFAALGDHSLGRQVRARMAAFAAASLTR